MITSLITPTVKVRRLNEEKKREYTYKAVGFSYIYVNIESNQMTIPARLYHFLKKIPGVLKIIEMSIPREEIESFCSNVGSSIEESEIEIIFNFDYKKEESKKKKYIQLINEKKTTSIQQRKELLSKIDKIDSNPIMQFIQIMKELKNKTNIKGQYSLSIKKSKVSFRLPLSVMYEVKSLLLGEGKESSNKCLSDVVYILPYILLVLKKNTKSINQTKH